MKQTKPQHIWTPASTSIVFTENKKTKGIIMYGVMMPSGEVSRNGVMYDWESVKDKHGDLVNRPVMYNHTIEGTEAVSIGHYTDSEIMTVGEILAHPEYKKLKTEIEKFKYPANKELWVYKADLDPSEERYINKIRRGDLKHVSIQLKAKDTEEKYDSDDHHYTYAYVGDIVEGSVVATPGFLATCAVLAEKFSGKEKDKKEKEDVNTGNADASATLLKEPKKEERLFLNSQEVISQLDGIKTVLKSLTEEIKMSETDPEKKKEQLPEEEEKKKEQVEDEEKKEQVEDEEKKEQVEDEEKKEQVEDEEKKEQVEDEEEKEAVEDEEKKEEAVEPNQKIDEETKKDHDPTPAKTPTKEVEKDHADAPTKEQLDEPKDDDEELGNMEKIVEILETMKSKMDEMDTKIKKMESLKEQEKDEEPKEPVTESLSLGKITLSEGISKKDNVKELGQAVKDVLY